MSDTLKTGQVSLSGLLAPEIAKACGFKNAFRAKQVFSWIAQGADDFSSMTNLSKQIREELSLTCSVHECSIRDTQVSEDGTTKLQIQLKDNNAIECVLLKDIEDRKTACISTQVGCPMACAFCKTGTLGFARNLTASEIVDQFLFLNKQFGPISNIVFMGMGEPLLNIDAVRKAISVFTHPDGLNMSRRRITLSTCGLVSGILDLADNGPHVKLAVSLTTANEALRTSLMPVNKANPLPELLKALKHYQEKTGDRITLEAAIMGNANSSLDDARAIAAFAKDLNAQVNIIPWNPIPGLNFTEPSRNQVEAFVRELERLHIIVTRRTRRGRGVQGACGQLGIVKQEDTQDIEEDDD